MTGGTTSKGLKELSRISPEPISKIWEEAARVQGKVEKQQKRTRRIIAPKKPGLLTLKKPDPLPSPLDADVLKKRRIKKKGRRATILAGRMNQRRQMLNTQFNTKLGESILR